MVKHTITSILQKIVWILLHSTSFCPTQAPQLGQPCFHITSLFITLYLTKCLCKTILNCSTDVTVNLLHRATIVVIKWIWMETGQGVRRRWKVEFQGDDGEGRWKEWERRKKNSLISYLLTYLVYFRINNLIYKNRHRNYFYICI